MFKLFLNAVTLYWNMVDSAGYVPITIKAPNQKIDDLLIHCNPNWSVRELKSYLSEVYPSKPHPNGQKLIYSGKLLLDSAIVNDVLKCYNGQKNNTIHLVCSVTKENPSDLKSSVKEPRSEIYSEGSSSGFNQNNDPLLTSSGIFGNPSQMNSLNQDFLNDRTFLMLTYMHYIAYYTQCPRVAEVPNEDSSSEVRPEQSERAQNVPANENVGANEERPPMRDWLDWVYVVSRLAVLFTIVYFYSSPVRCFMVTAMAFILYHLGMFRWRPFEINLLNINQLNNNNNNNNNGVIEGNVAEGVDEVVNEGGLVQLRERFGWMKVIFNILISFLLSLVPDREN